MLAKARGADVSATRIGTTGIASTANWVRSSCVFTVPTDAKNLCAVFYRDTLGAAISRGQLAGEKGAPRFDLAALGADARAPVHVTGGRQSTFSALYTVVIAFAAVWTTEVLTRRRAQRTSA